MSGGRLAVLLVVAVSLCWPGVAAAAEAVPVEVADLTGASPPEGGIRVVFEGEAIGEVIGAAGGDAWVNVLAGASAIGVVVSREDAGLIGSFGEYRRSGDVVRVTGRFERACDEHGGDRDVHADVLEVVRSGGPVEHPIDWWKGAVGIVAALFGVAQVRRARAKRTPY